MPALFAYLIAVALLLGGGYGALSWLAAPEPVKVVAKAKPKPPPAHYADNSEPAAAEASPSEANSADASKPEAASKTAIDDSDHVKAASNDKAVSSDQLPSASSSPQPEPPAAASQQEAKAQASGPAQDRQDRQQDRSAHAETPQPATSPEARQQVEAPPAEAKQNDSAAARREEGKHEEEKQLSQAVSPGNAPTIASIAPAAAAKTAKRPHVRQASRRSEQRPLEVMTLRTIELPDGRRITQLIPRRSGDRYRDDGPPAAFEPDE
jgi:hypothetical protein